MRFPTPDIMPTDILPQTLLDTPNKKDLFRYIRLFVPTEHQLRVGFDKMAPYHRMAHPITQEELTQSRPGQHGVQRTAMATPNPFLPPIFSMLPLAATPCCSWLRC